ncbi:efflux RND transporter periplasmic adaptor subunit [Heyndrickxia acidicola]|uniref:Efflux RND transporter periplasmic adaptor subunit n=1 Tax=Heyndrickxia acidicola TaxID=209389 RepID=A0ABU6MRM3_9BACI|nr:efflux RND transporter periplasmic adaptor subunit [Heyndrickxia acidicola]MED1205695.1 efflux RND transporter periplasmic adaptor subunit [Heyndrickxia acidicola]
MSARRMILINVILLVILVGGGFTGYYFYNKSVNYLSTDNAMVSGQQVAIASPGTGTLTDWNAKVGDKFNKGEKLGTVQVMGPDGKPANMNINAPADGTIVQNNGVENSIAAAGSPLAITYDLDKLWVTANIKETDINDVKAGQDVDVYVDAFPNANITGKVDSIGEATAGSFSLIPTNNNTSGNYTKETQVIPVKITLDSYGVNLVPGMNVTVRIHK